MSLRTGHGAGRGVPRIEVLPGDELPQPVPTALPTAPLARRRNGQFADPEAAKAAGRLGGLRKAERTRLLGSLGLVQLGAGDAFRPYEDAGESFVKKHIGTLAAMFDGTVSEGPASIVQTSGIHLAASRFTYDEAKKTGDAKGLGEASRLGDASRQSLMAAYELQSREAAARANQPRSAGEDDF